MKLINLILSAALAAGVAANSFGSVFFSIDLGTLQDENGGRNGEGMLILLPPPMTTPFRCHKMDRSSM